MIQRTTIDNCKHCQKEMHGPFCAHCGRPRELKRINGAYILAEMASVFNFERGILFSVKELLIRPGRSVHTFILDDRARLVKPLVFLLICSLVYTGGLQYLNYEDAYVNYSFEEGSATGTIFDWITQNYGYANILMAVLIAMWIKLLFRKHHYNYFEVLILLCFLIGVGMLIFSVSGLLESLTGLPILDKGVLVGVLYISWGIGQFFRPGKFGGFLKGFLTYMLGVASFSILAMVLGLLIDGMGG